MCANSADMIERDGFRVVIEAGLGSGLDASDQIDGPANFGGTHGATHLQVAAHRRAEGGMGKYLGRAT